MAWPRPDLLLLPLAISETIAAIAAIAERDYTPPRLTLAQEAIALPLFNSLKEELL